MSGTENKLYFRGRIGKNFLPVLNNISFLRSVKCRDEHKNVD